MTNQDNGNFDGPVIDHDANEKPNGGRYGTAFIVGVGIAAVIAIGAGAAIAQGFGMGPGGMGGFGGHMGMRFAEHRFEKVMDEIGASAEQQDKIFAIVDKTRAELRPMGREFRGMREEVAALLTAPTIDRAAVEALRAKRIAEVDEASKKAVAAVIEAAEVLTPEQRAKLAAEMKDRHEGRGRW
ncbi:MAG: Spy/CpxP family protein refolding chaperone [Mesorhizobium sp.]|nr:Spy/CpxP family protein refolding chaperone [Mesorhizobium sp.]